MKNLLRFTPVLTLLKSPCSGVDTSILCKPFQPSAASTVAFGVNNRSLPKQRRVLKKKILIFSVQLSPFWLLSFCGSGIFGPTQRTLQDRLYKDRAPSFQKLEPIWWKGYDADAVSYHLNYYTPQKNCSDPVDKTARKLLLT